jgi:hypothetical protein
MANDNMMPPTVPVPESDDAPVSEIKPKELRQLGQQLSKTFHEYARNRRLTEEKWLRNLRQYLGIYDPEIERQLSSNRSKAYPRLTRVKCVSVVSRVMNLMFPGNEKNWTLKASPSPDMNPADVQEAVQEEIRRKREAGLPPQVDEETVRAAVNELANDRARALERHINDQLQEIGGDQTADYVSLNRKVVQSGVLYGLGVIRGPFVREVTRTVWVLDEDGNPAPQEITDFKPQFEFLPVWDFFPDMTAKNLHDGDGYFVRLVMSKSQLRKLGKRQDFFEDVVKEYIGNNPKGNFKSREFETQLRTMGAASHASEDTPPSGDGRYEIIVWHGPVSAQTLTQAGVDVPEEHRADDVDAEVWMLGDHVIKAEMDPWKRLGMDVRTVHTFQFDEDDTTPIGNGIPNIMRDSQMSVCAATRMMLDNASITCGPNLEINTDLMRQDQDLTSTEAYKIWYREGMGSEAQQAAVRNVEISNHLGELQSVIQMFEAFADTETFVGPATGGDMERGYSEPMRTAAGASMMRGDAALPFKDIVRNFDQFTQSAINSLIAFNRKFSPEQALEGDFNVIARGATSLVAKEIRGQQVDQLAATLSPEERMHIDERKLAEARLNVRDMGDLLLPEEEVKRNREMMEQQTQQEKQVEVEKMQAEIREALAGAFKDIAAGQKDMADADAAAVKSATETVNTGLEQLDAADENERAERSQGAESTPRGTGRGLAGAR